MARDEGRIASRFTSESVTEGHPDKLADQISDAVLDAILAKDPQGRVACETFAITGQIHIAGEISTTTYVDIPRIVRDTIREVGYDRSADGLPAYDFAMVAVEPPPLTTQYGAFTINTPYGLERLAHADLLRGIEMLGTEVAPRVADA